MADMAEKESTAKRLKRTDRMVYEYLADHGESTVSDMSSSLGVAARTLRDVVRRFSDKGIVVASGVTKNRTYRLHWAFILALNSMYTTELVIEKAGAT